MAQVSRRSRERKPGAMRLVFVSSDIRTRFGVRGADPHRMHPAGALSRGFREKIDAAEELNGAGGACASRVLRAAPIGGAQRRRYRRATAGT